MYIALIDDLIFHALASNELRGAETSDGCHNIPVPLSASARHIIRLITSAVGVLAYVSPDSP